MQHHHSALPKQGIALALYQSRQLLLGGMLLFSAGCSSQSAVTQNSIQIIEETNLSQELGETSGLFCSGSKFYTINDSGNSPTLYTLSVKGDVQSGTAIEGNNKDWESVTADKQFFYIGDFGNNAGKRETLAIYKLQRTDLSVDEKIEFTYDSYNTSKNDWYGHDFDAEAMVARNDKLVLFSKSWLTNTLKIYHLDKSATSQHVEPFTEVKGIPGVVTGADWDKFNQRFVLVGYNSNGLGLMDPFVVLLSADYQLRDVYALKGYGQVEGICVTGDNEIWMTQETSPFSQAKLIKARFPDSIESEEQ